MKVKKEKNVNHIPDLSVELTELQQSLLDEFKILFLSDNTSSKKVIDLACYSFKKLFIKNYKYAERDLISLINIKKNNPNFRMIFGDDSYFDRSLNLIKIENISDSNTFNHELAHAIHYYTLNCETPEQFINLNIKINESKLSEFIRYVSKECNKYYENRKNHSYYDDDFKELKNSSNKYDLPNVILKYINDNVIDEKKFTNYYNIVSAREETIKDMENFVPILGFIDSLKKGEIYESGIEADFSTIKIGHEKEYFNNYKFIFCEVFACYIELIKSDNYNEEIKNHLKEIVGNEIIDFLDDFNDKLEYKSEIKKEK